MDDGDDGTQKLSSLTYVEALEGTKITALTICEQEGITVSNFSAHFLKEITLGSTDLEHELDQVLDEESPPGGGEHSEHDEEEDSDAEGNAESTARSKRKKQWTGRSAPQKRG